jgi:AbrB family looped-hinge helix DNA binding protein
MNVRAKFSSKGQIVVPKELRNRLGFVEGTEVVFSETNDGLLIKPIPARNSKFPPITFEEFKSRRVKWTGTPVTVEDMDKAILKEASRRWREKNA